MVLVGYGGGCDSPGPRIFSFFSKPSTATVRSFWSSIYDLDLPMRDTVQYFGVLLRQENGNMIFGAILNMTNDFDTS